MTGPYPPPGQPYGNPYGNPYGQQPFGPPPENYLVWSILVTVFCCLPLGIVAIIKSNEVNTFWYQGLHDQARQSAEQAKKWAMWGALSSVIVIVLYFVVFVGIIGAGLSFLPH